MKILEKFATSDISIVDVKKVKNYLQKEIFTVSNSANEAFIDYDIFNRYNFIVTDLIKRKLTSSTEHKTQEFSSFVVTSPVTQLSQDSGSSSASSVGPDTSTTTFRSVKWSPGRTPNSKKSSSPLYPQSVSWSKNDILELSPMFPVKPDPGSSYFIDQLSHISHTYTGIIRPVTIALILKWSICCDI